MTTPQNPPPSPEAGQPAESAPYGFAPPPPGYEQPGGAQPGYGQPGYEQAGQPQSEYGRQGYEQPGYGQPGYPPPTWTQPMPGAPAYGQYAQPAGPIGRIRPTGMIILLFCVTLGIWGFIYYYQVHEEMKRHSGEGLGGVLAVVIAIIFGLLNPFLLSNEVGQLYARRGQEPPVTALTALWFFPGMFILIGPFVWFIQTNNALNEYWQSLGARETTLV
jgi:hypothetical protein